MRKFLKKLFSRKEHLVVVVILLFAAYLRLYRVSDYMTFLGDEGRDLLEVRKILSGDMVFLGPRSSAADFYYGPAYFYFITPFLWLFNYDPVGPAVFIGILGVITVFLVYYVGKKLFTETAALIAAALYTISPVVIAYSRSSWNPNPLPFVSLLTLYLCYISFHKNHSWKVLVLIGFLLGIAIQLQYLALFLGSIVFLFISFGSRFQQKKQIVLVKKYGYMLAGFLVGWSPFLAFEAKNGFRNLAVMTNYMLFGSSKKEAAIGFFENAYHAFFKLFARLLFRFPSPEQFQNYDPMTIQVATAGVVIFAVLCSFALFKIKNKLVLFLFSLWFFAGCLLFGFYKKEIYDYYLGFLFPLPFLLTGNLLSQLVVQKGNKYSLGRIAGAAAVFVLLFGWNVVGNPFQFAPNRQKTQVQTIAEFILKQTHNKPYNFALLTLGNSDHAYRYYFEINGKPPVEIKNTEIDPARKSVTEQLMVVCEDPNCEPLGASLWEVAGFGRAEVAGKWDVSVVKVYKLIHYTEQQK